MTNPFRWDPSLTERRTDKPLVRDPLRLALLVGALVITIGAFLPWAEGMIGLLPVRFGGFDGAADGLTLATLGGVLILMAWKGDFLEAHDGARRWAPMLIGLACIALWLLGRQSAEITISHWENDDGSGSLVVGYWIAGAGVIAVAIAGSVASLRRRPGETRIPLPRPRLPRRDDIESLSAGVGAVAGAVIGAVATLNLFESPAVGVPLLFFGFLGFVFGGFAGQSVGRRLRLRG
jgi:hypothetical protein